MVPQSGRKDFQSDNRFSMNPALPDSLYHSAAQPNSMRTFSGGATEKCCRISPKRHYTINGGFMGVRNENIKKIY